MQFPNPIQTALLLSAGLVASSALAQPAVTPLPTAASAAPVVVPLNSSFSKLPIVGTYKQTRVTRADLYGNCSSCFLIIRRITNNTRLVEFNGGYLIGTIIRFPGRDDWTGHAEFINGFKGWDSVPLRISISLKESQAQVIFTPTNAWPEWDAWYEAAEFQKPNN